ncbi:hypothetical protein BU24DRAFT_416449 [Aaosphaeria arxii CBS 175.79]|uniref:Mid2 domain-containing protein n=1 Tax=Aaosphaeria arxii CBS 175.79 TaxID=1450172 RepID=A0A6A5Y5D2_9PLEO|nr:uncharacterized protein BU24DRAFT_416449 [Aaosphaeria arxii CBS 175.79]KAF2020765.1 hypothetical protein BU24DRAFT_416449 [Aaosphaeria arxii CBS 175.79]
MFKNTICAFLAPALVVAVHGSNYPASATIPVNKHPARLPPTPAPLLPNHALFNRADPANIRGFISGNPRKLSILMNQNYLTCTSNEICATNTFLGAQGCCDPSSLAECILPTSCVPSTALNSCISSATDCIENELVTKCTNSDKPNCYELHVSYDTTTIMTEHGCAEMPYTITAVRYLPNSAAASSTPAASSSSTEPHVSFETVAAPASSSPSTRPAGGKKKAPVGAIVGGVVGGLVVVGVVAFVIVFIMRKDRKKKMHDGASATTGTGASEAQYQNSPAPGMVEYVPQYHQEQAAGRGYDDTTGGLKAWHGGHTSTTGTRGMADDDAGAMFTGTGAGVGNYPMVVEADGRAVHQAP